MLKKQFGMFKKAYGSQAYLACFEWGDRAFIFKGLFKRANLVYYFKVSALRPKDNDEKKKN